MADPAFRFFPWVRRGLGGALKDGPSATPRAVAAFRATISPEIFEDRSLALLGPGDVLGIDPRIIVRTDPRPGTAAVEPNYMASIEFDPPELPWLFSPEGLIPAPAPSRLRPWLALVVLDRDHIADPKPSAGCPLPVIQVPKELVASELPDLEHSWAFAHAQRVTGGEPDDGVALASEPDRSVSRLICPRRLSPFKRWLACLVPTYDGGVATGLGTVRLNPDAPQQKAWTHPATADIRLPVYWHWTFETGAAGDFEMLAARLRPAVALTGEGKVDREVARRARTYLGHAAGKDLAEALKVDDPAATIRLDAPLETLDRDIGTASDVPQAFAEEVAMRLEATDGEAETELMPPIYGSGHVKRDDLDAGVMATDWLSELNLDPRTRIAARIGGDVVRNYQEDLMHSAWEQVGDVLAANAQIERTRFLALVADRITRRHLERLTPERFLAVTSAMHGRVRTAEISTRKAIDATSLPRQVFDASARRLISSSGRLSRTMTRVGTIAGERPEATIFAANLADALQSKAEIVDPSVRPRSGLTTLDEPSRVRPDLADGFLAEGHHLAAATLAEVSGTSAELILERAMAAAVTQPNAEQFVVRRTGGGIKVGAIVKDNAGLVSLVEDDATTPLFSLERDADIDKNDLVRLVSGLRRDQPLGEALSVRVRDAGSGVREIGFAKLEARVDTGTTIGGGGTTRAGSGSTGRGLGNLGGSGTREGGRGSTSGTAASGAGRGRVLGGTIDLSSWSAAERRNAWRDADEVRRWNRFDEIEPSRDEALVLGVLPSPLKGVGLASKVSRAFDDLVANRPEDSRPNLVQARLAGPQGLAASMLEQVRPGPNFRKRLASLIIVPDWMRFDSETLDPIQAAPVFTAPFADLLARSGHEHFLPRDLEIRPDTVVALQVNPRWVAACMVGVNHEINRELIWRTYPTDGRGTSAGIFWDWVDDTKRDVANIHLWNANVPLAEQLEGDADTKRIVIAVRGALFVRYPNALVSAWESDGDQLKKDAPDIRLPQFQTFLPPDTALIGLDLVEAELPKFHIVLQEPISERRFGLDEAGTQGADGGANSASWATHGTDAGWLSMAHADTSTKTAAEIAALLLQQPVRVAIPATKLIEPGGSS